MTIDYPLLHLFVGGLLLLLGRRLFWLFVAAAGFGAGLELALRLFPHQAGLALIMAVVLGLLGALLAVFVQKIAVAVAGFLVGGYTAAVLCSSLLALHGAGPPVLAFVVGGVLGAMFMIVFFNWALIVLSSLEGAHFIVSGLSLRHSSSFLVFLALAMVGIVIQAATYRPPPRTGT